MIAKLLLNLVCALLLYASYLDIAYLRIPNVLVIAVAALFVPFAPAADIPLDGFLLHLATGGSMLLLGFLLFAFGLRFGGGDAKLFAALSLWCGFAKLLPFFTLMCAAGGILGLVVLVLRHLGLAQAIVARGWRIPALSVDMRQPCVPYAPAMAISFILISAFGPP